MNSTTTRRAWVAALVALALIFLIRFTPRDTLVEKTKHFLDTDTDTDTERPTTKGSDHNTYGIIRDKVAVITDTQYTPRLIPLILHYHAVLGPDWPIIFYTSEETLQQHFSADSKGSLIWQRAVTDKRISVRTIPPEIDLTHRDGVNIYLSRPWLWEQLGPAQHVLVFQADSIICGNAHRTVEDFFKYSFVGAPFSGPDQPKKYNGGLSLRNRTMILDILKEGNNWEEEIKKGTWKDTEGEDNWFSHKMEERGASLPDVFESLQFACQTELHLNMVEEPLGYHKIHIGAPKRMGDIAEWCPEISLTVKGTLEPSM